MKSQERKTTDDNESSVCASMLGKKPCGKSSSLISDRELKGRTSLL